MNNNVDTSQGTTSALEQLMLAQDWAILPAKLEQLLTVVRMHASGQLPMALVDASESASRVGYTMQQGVAIVPVVGTILKRGRGLQALSGVRTTIDIQADIQHALDNQEVSAIVLDIDSPGGTVDGTKQLADFVRSASAVKPVVTYGNGVIASAAYWIGSQANAVVAFDTTQVGSIGTVLMHQDWSAYETKFGVKTTFIHQGKYKVVGNPSEPLTDEGKAHIQERINAINALFVSAVKAARPLKYTNLMDDIANGAVFLAAEAMSLGLIDQVGNLQDAINLALKLVGDKKMEKAKVEATTTDAVASSTVNEDVLAELRALKAQNETLVASLQAKAELLEAKEKAEAAAQRQAAIAKQFADCKVAEDSLAAFAGLTDEQLSVVHKEISSRQAIVDKQLEALSQPTEGAHTEHSDTVVTGRDQAIKFVQTRDKCSLDEAILAASKEFAEFFTI